MFQDFNLIRKVSSLILIFELLLPAAALASPPRPRAEKSALTEDQKIIHVLNRLGYGPRPGDVERVKKIGLQKYISQQLNPATINDSLAESKVKDLEVFNMSTAEIFAKYPNPGALLRQLAGGKAAVAAAQQQKADAAAANAGSANEEAQAAAAAAATEQAQRERRQKLQELYRQYDLRPANQLVPQIVGNRFLRATYSERQLQEVMVDFWQNHFNVFAGKAAVRWYIPSYERDVLRKYALGNFKDLVVATAQSPAMLFYLDNFQSVSPNSPMPGGGGKRRKLLADGGNLPPRMRDRLKQQYGVNDEQLDARLKTMSASPKATKKRAQRGLNENYARELMELHTLGVEGGYTQKDIGEVAKAFSGWTIADPRGYRKAAAGMIQGTDDRRVARLQRQAGVPDDIESGQFYFNEKWHEKGPKTVLGQTVDEGGMGDGLKVIDILVNSPATAKFIARKLCMKFVSDNPSEALVNRVADAFSKSKGDIKTTLAAIFSDKEFFAPENYRAKIKTPFELAVSSIRALGGDTTVNRSMLAMLTKLGELPYNYQAPTGYPDTAEDWVNTGALLERLNFAVAVSSNRIPGTRVDLKPFEAGSKTQILDRAINSVLAGDVSPGTRATLLKQIEQPLPEVKTAAEADEAMADNAMADMAMTSGPKGKRRGEGRPTPLLEPTGNPDVFKAVSLVLGSPEFQRQ